MSSVRLGVTLPQFTGDADRFLDGARRAEELGFDSLFVFDHLWPLSGGKERPILECWTALAWLAAATERVELGTLVCRSSLRHPALVGKMAATVGAIAPGRITIGIGSGDEASRAENEAFGLPYYAEGERVDQLASAAQVVTAYLDRDAITYSDRFVRVEDLVTSPRPAARPRVWVAGRSDDVLEIAGGIADGWNGWGGTPERFAQDALRVAEFAADAGGRSVEPTWGGLLVIARDDEEARAKLGNRKPDGYVVGGPKTVAHRLARFIDAGARHLVLTAIDSADPRTFELLAGVRPLLGI